MSFKNELVNSLGNEESDFFQNAKSILRTGFNNFDCWVVDRDHEMVLFKAGSGHDVDNYNCEIWKFIDRNGTYFFSTEIIESKVISNEAIAITRTVSFWRDSPYMQQPDSETISHIKDGLSEYKDLGLFSTYQRCETTLIRQP